MVTWDVFVAQQSCMGCSSRPPKRQCKANIIGESLSQAASAPAAGIDPYDANATAPHEMVSFTASFHGRTLGALALTYKEQYKTPFAPVMPGAKMAKYLDLDSAKQLIKKVRHTRLQSFGQGLWRCLAWPAQQLEGFQCGERLARLKQADEHTRGECQLSEAVWQCQPGPSTGMTCLQLSGAEL